MKKSRENMEPLDWKVFAGVLKNARHHANETLRERYGDDIPAPAALWVSQMDVLIQETMEKGYGDKAW